MEAEIGEFGSSSLGATYARATYARATYSQPMDTSGGMATDGLDTINLNQPTYWLVGEKSL